MTIIDGKQIKRRIISEKNYDELAASNIDCGEHYAVLEDKGGMWVEIDCPMDRLKK